MGLSIIIFMIWRGSVLLPPSYFDLRLVYKARNRPTGHLGEQAGPGKSMVFGTPHISVFRNYRAAVNPQDL